MSDTGTAGTRLPACPRGVEQENNIILFQTRPRHVSDTVTTQQLKIEMKKQREGNCKLAASEPQRLSDLTWKLLVLRLSPVSCVGSTSVEPPVAEPVEVAPSVAELQQRVRIFLIFLPLMCCWLLSSYCICLPFIIFPFCFSLSPIFLLLLSVLNFSSGFFFSFFNPHACSVGWGTYTLLVVFSLHWDWVPCFHYSGLVVKS